MTHRPFTMTLKNSSETCLHIEIMEEDITVLELLADIAKLPCYSDHSTKLETSGYSNWIYRLIPPESAKTAVLCLRIAKHDNTRALSYKGALVSNKLLKDASHRSSLVSIMSILASRSWTLSTVSHFGTGSRPGRT